MEVCIFFRGVWCFCGDSGDFWIEGLCYCVCVELNWVCYELLVLFYCKDGVVWEF